MTIEHIPIPPLRDLSKPQDVARLVNYLRDLSTVTMRISDNADAPTAPSAIAVRQGAGKTVEISVTFSEPNDWGTTELWRSTTDDSSTATKIDSKKAHVFHDVNVLYGSTYYYWAKVVGFSGTTANTSGWSPSSSHSINVTKVALADMGTDSVDTTKAVVGSMTINAVYSNDATINVTTTETIVGNATLQTDSYGQAILIGHVTVDMVADDGTATTFTELRIRRGSTITDTQIGYAVTENNSTAGGLIIAIGVTGYDVNPGTSQPYVLTARASRSNWNAAYRSLIGFNLKR